MNRHALLDSCRRLARDAGEAILAVYAGDFDVMHKADDSPLTRADLAAHRIITRGLAALTPELPCLSEEAADIGYDERRGWTRYWLVDPLDGTREFVNRNDDFTVNIALIDHGVPMLGVVLAPALDVSYSALRGEGAWRDDGAGPEAIRSRPRQARPRVAASRSHCDAMLTALLAALPEHDVVHRGSALKFGLVAEGEVDLYLRTGPTSEWDTAAGQCVVEAAGGAVRTLPDWQALAYNRKASLLNPGFIVAGDDMMGWQALLEAAA